MKNNFIILFLVFFLISSCSGNVKRSQNSSEFLIQKKNPLVMPPDIDDLPAPNDSVVEDNKNNNFKETLKSKKTGNKNKIINENSSLKDSIIKKIEE